MTALTVTIIAHDNGRLGRAQLATRRNGRWCGCGRTDGDRDAVQQSAGDAAGPQLHSAAAALAAVHRQRRLRRRLHEPRAGAPAASPQYRSGVHADWRSRASGRHAPAAPTRPSPSSTRRPTSIVVAEASSASRATMASASVWRWDGPGGVTGSLQGPRYPPSCCRGGQLAERPCRPPGSDRRSGIPRLPRNRGRCCRASFPPHSGRTFPVGGSPGTISDSRRR